MGEWLLIALAAVWAGMINSVVGSGTLVTFPTLVWLGFPPLTANISNNLGLVPGALTAFLGTRDQLLTSGRLIKRLLIWSATGGALGAVLLVVLPERVFREVIPFFILLGVVLVLIAPRISDAEGSSRFPYWVLAVAATLSGVYGGYFGAAQGVILIGILHAIGSIPLKESVAGKNALVALVTGIASVVFIFSEHIDWAVVAVVAVGSTCGAYVGSRYGRLIPIAAFRLFIAGVGLAAASWFFFS